MVLLIDAGRKCCIRRILYPVGQKFCYFRELQCSTVCCHLNPSPWRIIYPPLRYPSERRPSIHHSLHLVDANKDYLKGREGGSCRHRTTGEGAKRPFFSDDEKRRLCVPLSSFEPLSSSYNISITFTVNKNVPLFCKTTMDGKKHRKHSGGESIVEQTFFPSNISLRHWKRFEI